MLKQVFKAILFVLCFFSAVLPVCAQGPSGDNGFFDKDSVRDVFGPELTINNSADMEYFPRQPPKEDPAEEALQQVKAQPAKTGAPKEGEKKEEPAQLLTALRQAEGKDPVADELVAQYGDPNKKAPIKAVESAPTPFKGMMAALEAGREDIAMMYARQYARHIQNLQDRSRKVLDLSTAATMAEAQSKMMIEEAPPQEAQDGQETVEPAMNPQELELLINARAMALVERAKNDPEHVKLSEAAAAGALIEGQGKR